MEHKLRKIIIYNPTMEFAMLIKHTFSALFFVSVILSGNNYLYARCQTYGNNNNILLPIINYEYLVNIKACITERYTENKIGDNILMQYSANNLIFNNDVAKALINITTDINKKNKFGKTAAIHAAEVDNYDMYKLLVAAGADTTGAPILPFDDNEVINMVKNNRISNYKKEDGFKTLGDAFGEFFKKGKWKVVNRNNISGRPSLLNALVSYTAITTIKETGNKARIIFEFPLYMKNDFKYGWRETKIYVNNNQLSNEEVNNWISNIMLETMGDEEDEEAKLKEEEEAWKAHLNMWHAFRDSENQNEEQDIRKGSELRGPNFKGLQLGISVSDAVTLGKQLGYYVYSYKPENDDGEQDKIESIAFIDTNNKKIISSIKNNDSDTIDALRDLFNNDTSDIYIANSYNQVISISKNAIKKFFSDTNLKPIDFVRKLEKDYNLPSFKMEKIDPSVKQALGISSSFISEDNQKGYSVTVSTSLNNDSELNNIRLNWLDLE